MNHTYKRFVDPKNKKDYHFLKEEKPSLIFSLDSNLSLDNGLRQGHMYLQQNDSLKVKFVQNKNKRDYFIKC